MDSNKRPIRVLHVVGGMNRAGYETWLMHILRHIDRERFRMDFLAHTMEPCAYDDEIMSLGSRVIPCLYPERALQYASNFKRVIREFGPYDIVHTHPHHFSGFVLFLAHRTGISSRIAHSHIDTRAAERTASFKRTLYLLTAKRMINRYATAGFACSQEAAEDLYSVEWRDDPRWRLLYYGIDLKPFAPCLDSTRIRSELRIPANAFVVGHVGRFYEQKNHSHVLEVGSKIIQLDPNAFLVLAGDGPLRREMEHKVAALGMQSRVLFLGVRSDIPRLMRDVMDVLLFPSLHEGLPVTLLEAQAGGLPCVVSDAISAEADVIPQLMHRVGLDQPLEDWVDAVITARGSRMAPSEACEAVRVSRFDIGESVRVLSTFYAALHNCERDISY